MRSPPFTRMGGFGMQVLDAGVFGDVLVCVCGTFFFGPELFYLRGCIDCPRLVIRITIIYKIPSMIQVDIYLPFLRFYGSTCVVSFIYSISFSDHIG